MTIGPTTAELAEMIGEDIKAMPDVATVLRPAATRGPGGYNQDFQAVTTQVVSAAILRQFPTIAPGTTPCRLTASVLSGGSEPGGPGQLVSTMGYTMTMPPDTDVQPRDRLQIQGTTFEVLAIKGAASWNLSDSATLVEVRT